MALLPSCWGGASGPSELVVNSTLDVIDPPEGTVTLREAMAGIRSGGRITFDPSLDGATIDLSIVGEDHSILRGEVFDPGFQGYQERDYGASALYARKDIVVDASGLPEGVTLHWTGGESDPARVLAVYGDLTLANVNISSGVASAVFLTTTPGLQPYTLARGGGIAVWGVARLSGCTISACMAKGDLAGGRDRGAFGGGIYGDVLVLEDTVVAGNAVRGYGAAGGGVYSVGGWDSRGNSRLTRCAVSGNLITGQHAYGGGVYSDGGGRGRSETITLTGCTIARNAVMDHPDLDQSPFAQYYYRGGGFYMSNGYLELAACTIAENQVSGFAHTFSEKPNMGGGGVAATIGDAHVVENMQVRHSIIAGNTVNGETDDLFTGSLIDFFSWGYNLFGGINFDYIHVPVPWWARYLSRKHYPKVGDRDGLLVEEVLSVGGAHLHPSILSVGVAMGTSTVLWYPPTGDALDTIPAEPYQVPYTWAGYGGEGNEPEDLLDRVLDQVWTLYSLDVASAFGTRDLSAVAFLGPAVTWPSEEANADWIAFWRELDAAIGDSMGAERLADDFWSEPFTGGPTIYEYTSGPLYPVDPDQLGQPRPAGARGDVGAIELE